MGKRWGKADFQALKDLEQRLDKLERVDFDRFCRDTAKKLAGRILTQAKKRTISGVVPDYISEKTKQKYWSGYTGETLRDAWTVLPVERVGDNYVVTIVNNTEYAPYVEFGHRQTPGRKVGAIERRLKKSWVPGRFVITVPMQEMEAKLPAILETKLKKFLYESLYGGK